MTVDLLLVGHGADGDRVLLIRRGNPPYSGQWALPGGFLDVGDAVGQQGEDLHEAAARELEEETGVVGVELTQVGVFGRPDRDPRHRTITVLYRADLEEPLPEAVAGDDAADARWWGVEEIEGIELAFDHAELLAAGLQPTR